MFYSTPVKANMKSAFALHIILFALSFGKKTLHNPLKG